MPELNELFTWVPAHQKIANWLKDYRNRQPELIKILKDIGITGFDDKNAAMETIELSEIDPFTFFCYIYKYGSEKRLKLLQALCHKLNIEPIPTGSHGIPSANAQKVWLFSYKKDRNNNEIGRLWDFFFAALENRIDNKMLSDILEISNVGHTKISEGLFDIDPNNYFPVNGPTKTYLKEALGIDSKFSTYSEYIGIQNKIKEKTVKPFYEISYDAWKWGNEKQEINYWIFQCNPNAYDIETALRNDLLNNWSVSAHKDKIKNGDKVIIWVTGKDSGCYALAEVINEPHVAKETNDSTLWKTEERTQLKAGIIVTHNLVENPLIWNKIKNDAILKNMNVGNQGTNFKATEEEYQQILNLIKPMNTRKYWIYAPGEKATKWDEFFNEGIMGLGWDRLGDLNKYKSREAVTKALQKVYHSDKSKKNDSAANYDFKETVSIGDIVIAKRGSKEYLGYGIVTSNYYYDDTREDFKKCRKMNWVKRGVWIEEKHPIVQKTLTDITKYPEYVERLKKLLGIGIETRKEKTMSTSSSPLNIILYGPPGTGKTYSTINRALEIIGVDVSNKKREELLQIFDKKVEERQIAFTTFHQSMTYEDFIEGIKPMEPDKEENPVIYKVQPGIFREMCIEAAFAIVQLKETAETKKVLDFSAAYDMFVDKLEEKLAKNQKIELETKAGGKVLVESISPQGNIIIKHIEGIRSYTVSKARLTKLQKDITNLDDVSNINNQFKAIIGGSNSSAYWSVLNAIRKEKPQIRIKGENSAYTFEEMKEVVFSLKKEEYKNSNAKNYVLIIDEINRGNISQIFGELITLIEEDKRLGCDEALDVILPYSREKFGVPSNLYILATMNTADRSVEALDAALRRRFSFEFMPPLYGLSGFPQEIDGVNIPELLKTINKGISYLLDEDHQIGHSYFMNVKDKEGLRDVFKKNVIPLLKEYFYNDLGKIYMILGEQFVEIRENIPHFAGGINDEIERTTYHIKEIDGSFPIIEACESIIGTKK